MCANLRSWSECGEAAQTVAKPGLMVMKVLLCIWWEEKEIAYNEGVALQCSQTLNSDIHCQQQDHLKLEIDQKWPELNSRISAVFHYDNTRPHTSVVIHQKLWELVWEVLMHPSYSRI
ncbi:transposase [Trichonephila clavipes]|nr:transposase [Trichonephila clavipes]